MKNVNYYLTSYQMVEEDFLKIIHYIYVNDEQISVCSIPLADVILRTAVYIESISKELYEKVAGQQLDEKKQKRLKFDVDCLRRINDEWKLEYKEISVISQNLFLTDKSRLLLRPLQNAHILASKGGAAWNVAYQALKHNQIANIKKATVENALNILGALYILCIYYSLLDCDNQKFSVFDARCGSKLFSAHFETAIIDGFGNSFKNFYNLNLTEEELKKSIFLVKFPDSELNKAFEAYKEALTYSYYNCLTNPVIQQYIKTHPDEIKNINPCISDAIIRHVQNKLNKKELENLLSYNCPNPDFVNYFFNLTRSDFQLKMRGIEKEVKLNTNNLIYPSFSLTEDEIRRGAKRMIEEKKDNNKHNQ
ncbi:hypothetical protein M3084_08975 [Succinatimonas hippei]|uniref:hypothetical protein n=1 Tax=Succinatimonas hippei TaxID=626938 RepID=UPI0020118764|nr:hypothetical protein [Succinatimonas hippei]MCL1603980.1 hypothetical protein [Succinatimonas hippei]